MNIRNIMLAGLMLAWAGIAHAANVLTVQDVEVAPGGSVTLSVSLDNETTNLMGWQCDIVLPEGLTLALKENGKPDAKLGERFSTTEHSISSNRLANGVFRFIATSMGGEAIPGTSGTLFTVTLMADGSLAERAGTGPAPTPTGALMAGTVLAGKVTNIEFNTQDNQRLTLDDVAFNVIVLEWSMPQITYNLVKGWNWISVNIASEEQRDSHTFLAALGDKVVRLVGQMDELINDSQYGLTGGLQTLDATAGYKLLMNEAATLTLVGASSNPSGTLVRLHKGWNWLGYVPTTTMPVSQALKNLLANDGDRLVCQDDYAEYRDGTWSGSLTTMEPGKGYMYLSGKNTEFLYP